MWSPDCAGASPLLPGHQADPLSGNPALGPGDDQSWVAELSCLERQLPYLRNVFGALGCGSCWGQQRGTPSPSLQGLAHTAHSFGKITSLLSLKW